MTLQLCRFSLAFIWIYQGIVPKWLGPHEDELAMNQVLGASHKQAMWIAYGGGALEVLLGLAILVWWRRHWPYQLSAAGIGVLSLFIFLLAPQYLLAAFNAATVNVAILALSVIALVELLRGSLKRP